MNRVIPNTEQADYGIDGPEGVLAGAAGALAGIVLGVAAHALLSPTRPRLARVLVAAGAIAGVGGVLGTSSMLWSSRVAKLRMRDRLMTDIPWRGDERVLDAGCGRGLLLIGAAKRLTTGKAVGVDVWTNAQSDNRPAATWENARREGVADRIQVEEADARPAHGRHPLARRRTGPRRRLRPRPPAHRRRQTPNHRPSGRHRRLD